MPNARAPAALSLSVTPDVPNPLGPLEGQCIESLRTGSQKRATGNLRGLAAADGVGTVVAEISGIKGVEVVGPTRRLGVQEGQLVLPLEVVVGAERWLGDLEVTAAAFHLAVACAANLSSEAVGGRVAGDIDFTPFFRSWARIGLIRDLFFWAKWRTSRQGTDGQ